MNQILREKSYPNERKFQIIQGDITEEKVDAIVNAANERLTHGGGVAGVISRKGGSTIQQESDRWVQEHGPVSHAEPAYTSGGNLPCQYVIHAVGPVWGSGEEDMKLAAAVKGTLETANSLGLRTISLPAISTGIFGFPKARAARLIFETIDTYLGQEHQSSIELVRLVLFDQATADIFLMTLKTNM
jgi:O-acetyl-ADP-ribose deacetylase (regulator of RNase III)